MLKKKGSRKNTEALAPASRSALTPGWSGGYPVMRSFRPHPLRTTTQANQGCSPPQNRGKKREGLRRLAMEMGCITVRLFLREGGSKWKKERRRNPLLITFYTRCTCKSGVLVVWCVRITLQVKITRMWKPQPMLRREANYHFGGSRRCHHTPQGNKNFKKKVKKHKERYT